MPDGSDLRAKIADARLIEAAFSIEPSVITYSRLEPRPLTNGDLLPGLQALVGDPLWLVGRQWQFEELRGEDGGSPVLARIELERARVSRFHGGPPATDGSAAERAVDVPGDELPVEVAVEAERSARIPERVRAQLGQQLLRSIGTAALPAAMRDALRGAVLAAWAFGEPADDPMDPLGSERRRLLTGRVPDSAVAVSALMPLRGQDGALTRVPDALAAAAGGQEAGVREVLGTWLAWAETFIASPVGSSWVPHRLEYAFAVAAKLDSGEVILHADEYASGSVDWYSFDAATGPALGEATAPVAPVSLKESVIPTPVRYPGMPSDRLWAFEDARVYLGGLDAGPTDVARLALVEFALVYGTDWFLAPVDLPYGSVARLDRLVVQDTFGHTVDVGPSRDIGQPGWTVFQNDTEGASRLADLFLLPATVRHPLEGPPLEEVALFRDEMANLVWAVERVVQGPSGEPVRRDRLAAPVTLRQAVPGDLGDARIVYRLMSPVPEHWVPFVAVPVPDRPVASFATELERRPIVRFRDDGTVDVLHPQGTLLRADPDGDIASDRLRIADEEVPREGVVVTRTFQLARTTGGGTVLWIGRRKRVGTGEGWSGLRFDTALPPGAT